MRLLRSFVILIFLATAGTVTLGIWSALLNSDRKELLLVPSSAAADAGKTAPPAPAALKAAPAAAPAVVATASPPPARILPQPALVPASEVAARPVEPSAFDPLDLTPRQAALIEQSYSYGQAIRRREETLAMRERALEMARLELDRRLDVARKTLEQASASQRAAVESELEGKRKELLAKQSEITQREESLKALATKIREDATQKTEKAIAAYRSMKPKKVAAVLSQMDAVEAATVLYLLPDEQRAKVVSELDPTVAGALLRTPFASEFAKLSASAK